MLPSICPTAEFGSDDTAVVSGFGSKIFLTIFEVNVAKGVKIQAEIMRPPSTLGNVKKNVYNRHASLDN